MLDVLSLCYGTFASGAVAESGNAIDGDSDWRAFWDVSLALGHEDDDFSELAIMTCSQISRRHPVKYPESHHSSMRDHVPEPEGALRPVSFLCPQELTRINEFITVAEAAKRMRQARVEDVVVTTEEGELRGILTDTDIVRRVLAEDVDPERCSVASAMTTKPSCFYMEDPAIEAITKMLEGRFKHMPVLGVDGTPQGMLDISECLYDAITCMEKVQQSTEAAASEFSRELAVGSNLQRLLGPMMERMVRPTVGDALDGEIMPPVVNIHTSVARAAKLMANTKKAAIVLSDEKELCGMVTTTDLLRKLVDKGLYAETTTTVEEVMTVDPDLMGPNVSIVDGLRSLRVAGQLFMPVLDHDGEILAWPTSFVWITQDRSWDSVRHLPLCFYLPTERYQQFGLTWRWIGETSTHFALHRQTAHFANQYAQVLLRSRVASAPEYIIGYREDVLHIKRNLRVLGLACVFMAAKIEEVHPPRSADIVAFLAERGDAKIAVEDLIRFEANYIVVRAVDGRKSM
ncbi:hypothetical protein PsorP6_010088 [Peronosclerospora sorghi]|uniref:Uncharacterized protein n=1 Tax=Peronosclerospora sorghi TaxID=230839 RepID=A0ACC0VV12_9STRA|nr:hypothetical protein PsorP6_010088 [Peronosclerospora sorghi]